jgi:propionyl-CoA carboxylase alpha chain
MNTRLQVEHPVTELVHGVDLVELQLGVAEGRPTPIEPVGTHPTGHAIEVRLYAEDPAAGFLPATGTIAAFEPAAEPAVRWESGVEAGSVVGVDYDPMLAKVVAHGQTRVEAAGRLALALERLHLGGITTNRDFLAATLRHAAFLAGDTTTDFIDRHDPPRRLDLDGDGLQSAAAVAALWLQGVNRASATVLGDVPSGWRNARLPAQNVTLAHGDDRISVAYQSRRDGSFAIGDGTAVVHEWTADGIDVEIDGRRSRHRISRDGERLFVQAPRGTVELDLVPRFVAPGEAEQRGGFVAAMPGVVLDVRCAPGDVVTAGQTLVVLEAMKMEHRMNAPADGTVAEVRVVPGQHVELGAVLVVFEEPATEPSDG